MLHEGLSGDAVRAGMTALSKIDPTRYESFFTRFSRGRRPFDPALAVRCRSLSSIEDLFEVLREHVRDQDSRVIQASLESLQQVPVSARPTEGVAHLSLGIFEDEGSTSPSCCDRTTRASRPKRRI